MNMNHFIYFIEVVKKNSFTKAAESLFISQSTISKAIRTLEEKFDTELIDRTAHTFKLTEAGKIFYTSAVKIIQSYRMETDVLTARLNSRRGTLTLSIPPVTITIMYPILSQYHAMYPEVILKIHEIGAQTAYALIKQAAVDMSILIHPFKDPDFYQIPLMNSEAVCVVSNHHRLANYETITLQKLKNENFLIFDDTYMLHNNILTACQKAGFTPRITLQSKQWDLLVEAASLEQGISILPRPIIERFCPNKVKMLHIEDAVLPWIPILTYHKEKFLSAPMKLFIDMVQARKLT